MMTTRIDQAGRETWVEEAVDLEAALSAYTVAGAYASFEDRIKGRFAAGQLADAVVFDRDLDDVPLADLGTVRADLTIQDGRVVYERTAVGTDQAAYPS
jgi:predicted amidohydrolase YtcJ